MTLKPEDSALLIMLLEAIRDNGLWADESGRLAVDEVLPVTDSDVDRIIEALKWDALVGAVRP